MRKKDLEAIPIPDPPDKLIATAQNNRCETRKVRGWDGKPRKVKGYVTNLYFSAAEAEPDTEEAETEAEEESQEELEEPKVSPAEAEEQIAPAQKQQPPKAERDLATMMGGLQKAVKARNWDAALSFAEGIEAALRKIRNS